MENDIPSAGGSAAGAPRPAKRSFNKGRDGNASSYTAKGEGKTASARVEDRRAKS